MAIGAGKGYAPAQTTIGLAIETSRGTAVTPTLWIPVRSPKYKIDITEIPDQTLQGSMAKTYDLIPGLRYDGHGWDSYPYLDSFPVFVRAALGSSDTKTTASTSGKLLTAAVKGATSIKMTKKPTVGTFLAIGSAGQVEGHKVKSVTGTTTPFTVTLTTALVFTHKATATVTGLTGHKYSLLNNAGTGNQPPSVTITDYVGDKWRQLVASQLGQLTIKGNATGLLDYTCSWFGNPATTPTTSPSSSFSTVRPVPGWSLTAVIGTATSSPVVEWTLDLNRETKPTPAITGNQDYYNYWANPITAAGKLTVLAQATEPELTDYENGTSKSFDLTVFDISKGFAMEIHCSKAKFKTGAIDRSKQGPVEVPLDFEFLPTATDATAGGKSPCTVTIWNSTTTTI